MCSRGLKVSKMTLYIIIKNGDKNSGEWLVAKRMEILGFVFTGAGSNALALSQDKCRVKIILDQKDIPTPMWQIFNLAEPGSWDRFPAIVKPERTLLEGIKPDSASC